ncbi:hypothetical protein ABTY59_37300 [Streptomyces sp. NPDC096079]|uniref:hypothetical protein n=1 Tax=Streptomyces sp. NPDC096079 TaxID=3155820 RepID=UPI00331F79AD
MSPYGQGTPPYPTPVGAPRPRGAWPTAYLATVAGLGSAGFLLDGLVLYVSIFATDSCGTADPAPVCTGPGMLAMWALPWIGLGLATVVCVLLGVAAWRRGRTPWVWLPLGALLYAASLVGAWLIMLA